MKKQEFTPTVVANCTHTAEMCIDYMSILTNGEDPFIVHYDEIMGIGQGIDNSIELTYMRGIIWNVRLKMGFSRPFIKPYTDWLAAQLPETVDNADYPQYDGVYIIDPKTEVTIGFKYDDTTVLFKNIFSMEESKTDMTAHYTDSEGTQQKLYLHFKEKDTFITLFKQWCFDHYLKASTNNPVCLNWHRTRIKSFTRR